MYIEELWKSVDGYDGRYLVSNTGKVKTLYTNPPREMYQTTTNYGYKQVVLHKNGGCKHIGVHRLVAFAFVEGYHDGLEVNHKDLDKTNNVATNLEWVTKSENQKHQHKAHNKPYIYNRCKVCGKIIAKKSVYCIEHKRRNDYPEKCELLEDLKYLPMTKIGEKYGYTDKGIKKVCEKLGLPVGKDAIREYRKQCGTYIATSGEIKDASTKHHVHYNVNGIEKTAQGWSIALGLEPKRIGRFANKHTYEETVNHIKGLLCTE